RFAGEIAFHAIVTDAHASHADPIKEQLERACLIMDFYSALGCGLGEHLDEARAATDGLHGEPTPEFELALDLECLPAIDRNEALPPPTTMTSASDIAIPDPCFIRPQPRPPRHGPWTTPRGHA